MRHFKSTRSPLLVLAFTVALAVTAAAQIRKLSAAEAKDHIGESATVCGTVVSSRYASSTKGQPTFLNLDKPYPGVASPTTFEQEYPMNPFVAGLVDAPDGLSSQFRISVSFPAVPPGAVEEAEMGMIFRDEHTSCDAIYRLRFHSARQFYDFRFRIMIDLTPTPTKVKSTVGETEPKS